MATQTHAHLTDSLTGWTLSPDEQLELAELSALFDQSAVLRPGWAPVRKVSVRVPNVLNEAYDYPQPVAFSRALRAEVGSAAMLFISGTSAVDERGRSVHVGDFRAQCWRTYRNITAILRAQGASWSDVVRCTCYLRDIERDYRDFNRVRTAFFDWLQLDPLPASVGIQARLCREDLLVEIEALAIVRNAKA